MKITYTPDENGILYPNLSLPEEPTELGVYAMRHKQYLKEHRPGVFSALILKGKLNSHLAQVEQTALEMMEKLTREMAQAEGVTEQLKETDQMLWVQLMNSIRNRAEEIVNHEVIFN